ncbi:hypothetical protein Q427_04425 [Halomonas sp. BC04]|nr:hypothetical protein Q427_04425 [Halomonas sp. BC04]
MDAALAYQVLDLECRRAHGDTDRLEFVGERNNTAVVVREHSDGAVPQPRLEYPFAADVKLVAVHQADHTVYS